jgi:hypothetical protein
MHCDLSGDVCKLQQRRGRVPTGLDIASDGTKVVRTDTYWAYRWYSTSWRQLITAYTMPFILPFSQKGQPYLLLVALLVAKNWFSTKSNQR